MKLARKKNKNSFLLNLYVFRNYLGLPSCLRQGVEKKKHRGQPVIIFFSRALALISLHIFTTALLNAWGDEKKEEDDRAKQKVKTTLPKKKK